MRWTPEYTEQIKEKIKMVLVMKPNASKYELARTLGIDKDTALRLKKEIRQENLAQADNQKLFEEIGRLEMVCDELCFQCWKIIDEDIRIVKNSKGKEILVNITIRNKINAIRTIVDTTSTLFQTKLDAGIFRRKLEKPKTETKLSEDQKKLLEWALKEAEPKSIQNDSKMASEPSNLLSKQ